MSASKKYSVKTDSETKEFSSKAAAVKFADANGPAEVSAPSGTVVHTVPAPGVPPFRDREDIAAGIKSLKGHQKEFTVAAYRKDDGIFLAAIDAMIADLQGIKTLVG